MAVIVIFQTFIELFATKSKRNFSYFSGSHRNLWFNTVYFMQLTIRRKSSETNNLETINWCFNFVSFVPFFFCVMFNKKNETVFSSLHGVFVFLFVITAFFLLFMYRFNCAAGTWHQQKSIMSTNAIAFLIDPYNDQGGMQFMQWSSNIKSRSVHNINSSDSYIV